jgi:predicted HAD superfamily Cof-like phosphohydrolase
MTNIFDDIADFHQKFGLEHRPIGDLPKRNMLKYRIKFMLEELDELARAASKNDLVGMTDALVDIIYVAAGTGWLLNLPLDDSWGEVHHANMQKVRAQTSAASKRGTALDIIKPKDWKPPNLSQFFTTAELQMKIIDPAAAEQHDLIDYLTELKGRETHEQDTRDNTA